MQPMISFRSRLLFLLVVVVHVASQQQELPIEPSYDVGPYASEDYMVVGVIVNSERLYFNAHIYKRTSTGFVFRNSANITTTFTHGLGMELQANRYLFVAPNIVFDLETSTEYNTSACFPSINGFGKLVFIDNKLFGIRRNETFGVVIASVDLEWINCPVVHRFDASVNPMATLENGFIVWYNGLIQPFYPITYSNNEWIVGNALPITPKDATIRNFEIIGNTVAITYTWYNVLNDLSNGTEIVFNINNMARFKLHEEGLIGYTKIWTDVLGNQKNILAIDRVLPDGSLKDHLAFDNVNYFATRELIFFRASTSILIQRPCPFYAQFINSQRVAHPPAIVEVVFRLTNCMFTPQTSFDFCSFDLWDDGSPLDRQESDVIAFGVDVGYNIYMTILVDASGSQQSSLSTIADSMESFSERYLSSTQSTNFVSIYLFDGSESLIEVVSFTNEISLIQASIQSKLRTFQSTDRATNLNGAIIQGVNNLQPLVSSIAPPVAVAAGNLVIITNGVDEAGYKSTNQVFSAIAAADVNIFTIGVGSNIDVTFLNEVGRTGAYTIDTLDQLTTALSNVEHQAYQNTQGLYSIRYCSPRRAGGHLVDLLIPLTDGFQSGPEYSADGFTGGCTLSDLLPPNTVAQGCQAVPTSSPAGNENSPKTSSLSPTNAPSIAFALCFVMCLAVISL